jgi:hypothetical protein
MSKLLMRKKVMGIHEKQEVGVEERGDGNMWQTTNKRWGKKKMERKWEKNAKRKVDY